MDEEIAASIQRWRSVRFCSLNVNEAPINEAFDNDDAALALRACRMLLHYDDAKTLTLSPNLAAFAVAALNKHAACAQLLAGGAHVLLQNGGNCFSVLIALLGHETCAALVARSIASAPWHKSTLRQEFFVTALQLSRKEAVVCLVKSVCSDWNQGGTLWDDITSTAQGRAAWSRCHESHV